MAGEPHESWDGGFEDEGARCPHCGDVDDFAGDHPSSLQHDGDSTVLCCGSCGEDYEVTMCVSLSYATAPLFIGPRQVFGWPAPPAPAPAPEVDLG
jgi:hypothetical protein